MLDDPDRKLAIIYNLAVFVCLFFLFIDFRAHEGFGPSILILILVFLKLCPLCVYTHFFLKRPEMFRSSSSRKTCSIGVTDNIVFTNGNSKQVNKTSSEDC